MSEKLDDCQSACMEAENEFYEASDKIEVQRYLLGVVIMGYDSRAFTHSSDFSKMYCVFSYHERLLLAKSCNILV